MKHPRPASLDSGSGLTAGTVALGSPATDALAAETVTVCAVVEAGCRG